MMIDERTHAKTRDPRRQLDRAGASTYRVLVRDLVLSCSIGTYERELRARQRVRFNIELDVADPGSFAAGELAKVFNYEKIVDGIKAIAGAGHIALVETLAERVAALCLADPRALRASVTVEKLDVYPEADGIGVTLVRTR